MRATHEELKQRLAAMITHWREKKREKKVTIKVTLSAEAIKHIEKMGTLLHTDDPAEVLRYALPLLETVLTQVADGRILIFRDRTGERRDVAMEFGTGGQEKE